MRATGDRDRRPSPYPRPSQSHRAPVLKSSKRRRYLGGAAALAVAGALTMGFMAGGTAMAEGEGDQVVFNGKCGAVGLGIGNKSVPDKAELSVTSGDKVTFTNNLGTDATLHIGSTESKIEKGDSKSVTLSNNTEAKMSPKCPLVIKDHSETTTVSVQPRQQEPGSGDSDSGDGQDDGSSSGGSSGGDSAAGGSTGADKPDDSPDTGKKPKADGKAGDPNSGDDADEAKKQDDEALAPGDTGGDDSASDAGKVDATNKVSNENSASGLLAALAALCLAGVGFAAIRTFVSGRAAASA